MFHKAISFNFWIKFFIAKFQTLNSKWMAQESWLYNVQYNIYEQFIKS